MDDDELAEYFETSNKRKKKKAEKKETPEEVAAQHDASKEALRANFYASFKNKEEFMEYIRNTYIPPTIDRKEYIKYEEERYMKYRGSTSK